MAEYKFDIFKILDRVSTHDRQYFDALTVEDWKGIQPLVLMRWLTGTSNKQQVYLIDTVANEYIFPLARHKRLLISLLMVGCSGKSQRYRWCKPASKPESSKPMSVRVIMEYFRYAKREAMNAMNLIVPSAIISMAEDMGYPPGDIQKIRKEHKVESTKNVPNPLKGGFEF